MAAANDVSTMNGLFKTVYADKLLDLVPDYAVLQKRVDFAEGDKTTGAYYAQPVNLSHEAGFTYAGSTGGTNGALIALGLPVAGTMKEAQVYGSELILRSQLRYTALSRAAHAGKAAFKRASGWKVEDMNNSMRKRLEIAMLYGQVGVGTVSSLSSQDIILTEAGWAGGIWAGSEGAVIDVFQSNLSTLRAGDLTITAVNSDTRTLTVTGTTTGIVSTDVIFFDSSNATGGSFNEMAGLQKIIANTGTLFGISASSFSLWKGTTLSSTGQLTHGKIQDAVAKAVNKGLMEKCLVLVSPKAWGVLNADASALRVFDSSYSKNKSENGAEALVFHATNGQLEILSHPLVKDGDAFVVPLDSVLRIGSVDLTFGVPGMEEQFFRLVDGYNGVEIQCMADQAIFLEKPAHAVYLSGISYA